MAGSWTAVLIPGLAALALAAWTVRRRAPRGLIASAPSVSRAGEVGVPFGGAPRLRRAALAAGAWALLWAGANLPLAATASTTSQAAAESSTPIRPVPPGLTAAEACALTMEERVLVNVVTDGDDVWTTTGLFVLLRRAAMLPEGPETYDAAEHPDPLTFWSAPSTYRGRLVSLEAIYAGRVDVRSPAVNTEWWGPRAYYLMHVKAPGAPEAIVIALTQPPPKGLHLGDRIRGVGFFYKTMLWPVSAEAGNPTERRVYPVLVGRTVQPAQDGRVGWMPRSGYRGLLVAIAGALAVFLVIRLYLRTRQREQVQRRQTGLEPPGSAADDEMDPEFQRQMEEYLRDAGRPEDPEGTAKRRARPAGHRR